MLGNWVNHTTRGTACSYRAHDDGPLTDVSVAPGAVIVTMHYDMPGCYTRLHAHTFDHRMECVTGAARIVIDDVETFVRAGDSYMVEAHKRHGVWPLESGTVLRCVHEHGDIHPDGARDGIPLEWLARLTHSEATA